MEVEHQGRVQGYTAETGLEVEVRTCTASCITTQADWFTSLNILIFHNKVFRHVTVDGLQTVVVTDNDVFTIALRLVIHDTDLSAECSTDGITNVNLDVQSFVLTSPACTEIRGDDAA